MSGPPPGMPNLPDPDAIFSSWWPIVIAVTAGAIYALRQYMRGAKCVSTAKLDGKVAIVTGTTSGIGKFVAKDLASRGCKVYMACRNTELGDQVSKELKEKTKNEHVSCIKCDLMSFESIQQFVNAFKKKETKLDILINNAGVMMCPREETTDGFETQFQVNYLGPALLTHLLLDMLKSSGNGRIVNTAAPAYQLGSINWDDVNYKADYVPGTSYAQSKFALVAFSIELAANLLESGVKVSCVLPGVVNSRIYRHLPFKKNAFVSLSFSPFIWFFMKTVEDGAQTTLFCAVGELGGKLSGTIFKECAPVAYSDNIKDPEQRTRLWNETLSWLNIKEFGVTEDLD